MRQICDIFMSLDVSISVISGCWERRCTCLEQKDQQNDHYGSLIQHEFRTNCKVYEPSARGSRAGTSVMALYIIDNAS